MSVQRRLFTANLLRLKSNSSPTQAGLNVTQTPIFTGTRISVSVRGFSSSSTHNKDGRTYSDAIEALNSIQSNWRVVQEFRNAGKSSLNREAISQMDDWFRRMNHDLSELDSLNAIHIAGTKGKGSTAAFISSILKQYSLPSTSSESTAPPLKFGLYTSPHLRSVRERIQVSGYPLTEEEFTSSFFEIWDRFESTSTEGKRPNYFRFLTLLAFHTYLKRGVNAAVIECGIGGEFDSTNIIRRPAVSAITSLGIDHVAMLGETLPEIAWHKAGIMKTGVPAFTAPQPQEALDVLFKRAAERDVTLKVVDIHPQVADGLKLGLAGEVQKVNASVAIAAAASFLNGRGYNVGDVSTLPAPFVKGLRTASWPGRCDTRYEDNLTWYIDGAHTPESIEVASKWFLSSLSPPPSTSPPPTKTRKLSKPHAPRILLFNQQSRDGGPLLSRLHETLLASNAPGRPLTYAIFCTNTTSSSTSNPELLSLNTNAEEVLDLKKQRENGRIWEGLNNTNYYEVCQTVEDAVRRCREVSGEWALSNGEKEKAKVFVTGSLHLVGALLEVLESEKERKSGMLRPPSDAEEKFLGVGGPDVRDGW